MRGKSGEFRGMRKQIAVLSEEVRGRSEEVSSLFPPRSSLFALPSKLLSAFCFLLSLTLLALPSSLLALDGLPFDGWQRINTGYCPAAGDRFECEVTVADVQPRSTAALFGTVREQEPERTFAFYVRQGGDDSSVVAYGDMARGGFFPRGKRVTLSVGPDGAMWTWEGGFGRIELMPGSARDGVTPLMIGDVNAARFVGESVPAGTGAAMTLHRFRVWRGGHTLIHDYEPEQNGLRDRCCDDRFLKIDPESGVEKVKVSVKNGIPNVQSVAVHDPSGRLTGKHVRSATVYTVRKGDDITVYYTLEPGYASQTKNPIVYLKISTDQRIDGTTLKTVRRLTENVPYRMWDAQKSAMVDCVCSNAIPVTADTVTLKDGQWYAVTGTVTTTNLKVSGAAHLILCDGAKMTATGGGDDAGVAVEAGNSLAIYGQSAGTGELVAKATEQGGHRGAGIGGAFRRPGGTVTINGGRVTATGGWDGAGIGGGCYAASGAVTINGGRIRATGGGAGPGIGSGYQATGAGGTLVINGGTVMAKWAPNAWGPDGKYHGDDIGRGFEASDESSVNVTIKGGSVSARTIENAPSNGVERVYCVTAKWSEEGRAGRLVVEGLGEYGTNDIYSVDGSVYLWLPDGAHRFTISDGTTTHRYCAVVHGRGVTVEPLGPVGFYVNGEDIGKTGAGEGWFYQEKTLSLTNAVKYVLSGEATNDEVQVKANADGATVVLSNAVVFASRRAALDVAQGAVLTVAAGQMLKTGTMPETLKYAQSYKGESCVLSAPGVPVTPGVPRGSYGTAEAATNALIGAYIDPADQVKNVLVPTALLETYRDFFDIEVTSVGASWALEAVLTPEARTNLVETATGATRQIPVAAIARLKPDVTTNVTVQGCAPGFFYSLYDGWALTNIVADANATNLNVLCGADAKVTFPEVKKPSDAAGFFKVGVGVTDNVGKR